MATVILVIHLLLAIALVGTILIQRSEGGGLGMGGGGGGGMGGFMTGRAAANMLTRITGGLAACFIATSLILAIMAGGGREQQGSIVDRPTPAEQPAKPTGPAVPLAK
ncbi:MAG: preprotein translocase subunit SecG [Rhodospirillales bacterium]|jgi:preprotein translocase subunit SecG|nr:preprotein translocase subunit SecG [Rhodospirillales bacterium]